MVCKNHGVWQLKIFLCEGWEFSVWTHISVKWHHSVISYSSLES